MPRRTDVYRIMPWVGGINTSVDPGVLNPQQLVQADNVVFSSTGARIKREALEYLDLPIATPDFKSASGTSRFIKWTTNVLVSLFQGDERLVVGEKINVSGNDDYVALDAAIVDITNGSEVTEIECVADVGGNLAGKYFLISAGDPGTDYYVWYTVGGSGTDPEVVGRTAIVVDVVMNDTADAVATATQLVLDAHDDFTATVLTDTVTATAVLEGYVLNPDAGTSGFTLTVTDEGYYQIEYEAEESFSEAETVGTDLIVSRASAVIMVKDYWRFVDSGNAQLLVYATEDFQLFTLDDGGRREQIHGQEQETEVVCGAASTLTTGDYFLLNGANNLNNAYVWYNKDGGGGDPVLSDRDGIEVVITGGMTDAQVASATQAAVDSEAFFSATVDTATVTILVVGAGITDNSVDFNTGFTITTTAYGATTPTETVDRIRTNVFNERLQIYFTGQGNYPIIYNPEDNVKYQLMGKNTVDGLTMPDASFAFNHLSRVWCDDKTSVDRLHFSETFDETMWLGFGDSGAIDIDPGDGDPEGINNAYVYKGFIVAAKKASRHRILGDSPENFQRERISNGMGNEGPFSIPVDETDVVFLSKRGVHSQAATDAYGDTDAQYLSADIKPTFNSFDAPALADVQGTYIPELNSIALAIQEDGDQRPNNVWLFNFEVQVPGAERAGAWYRWPNISCTALDRRFITSKYKIIMGTSSGRVVQAQNENNYADFGTDGIEFRIKTGAIYPGQDPKSMKAFKEITMVYPPKGNFSFDVLAKIDNHQSQGFAFNQISGLDLLGEDFVLGVSILGASSVLAPYTYSMEGYGRGVTLTISQPTADEQIEIWGAELLWENLDIEEEVKS